MYSRKQGLHLGVLVLLLVGTACRNDKPLPEQALYVLSSGRYSMRADTVTALTIVDSQTWEIYKTVKLPKQRASSMALDPQGRIWIAFGRTFSRIGKEVRLYDLTGNLVEKLKICNSPNGGIAFAAGRAFVPCEENGFYSKVDIFDLASLERISTIDLQNQLVVAIVADENYVLVSGQTDRAPDYEGPDTSINVITLINPHTLSIEAQSERLYDFGVRQMLSYQDQFYLLNYESFTRAYEKVQVGMDGVRPIEERRRLAQYEENDLLVVSFLSALEPQEKMQIKEQALSVESPDMAPKWGTIVDDKLYALQADPSGFNSTPELGITRLDLKTGTIDSWPLADRQGSFKDIQIINGQIILSLVGNSSGSDFEGLYQVDLASGEITQVLHLPGAQKLLVVQ